MKLYRIPVSAVPLCLVLCSVVGAEEVLNIPVQRDAAQMLSIHIEGDAARMVVSDGTSFAVAKALVDALHAQDIADVTLSISEDGTPDVASKHWVYVLVDDHNAHDTQDSFHVSVSPDTSFTLAAALAGALTAVNDLPVRFISKKKLDSLISQSKMPLSQPADTGKTEVTIRDAG